MITDSMNAKDITSIRMKDDARLAGFQRKKANELLRLMNKQKVKFISTCYDFKTPNAEYKISIWTSGGEIFYSGIFGYVRERNVYIPMTSLEFNKDYYMAISPHFFNRYAERHLNKVMSVPKAMSYFFRDFFCALVIYSDDNRMVYAINDGIMLGICDNDKHIVYIKTFVSLEMLKDSQIKSYEKIKSFMEESSSYINKMRKKCDGERVNIALEKVYQDVQKIDTTEAWNIYATFFEKGGGDD